GGNVSDCSTRYSTGWSVGFCFCSDGGAGMPGGRARVVLAMTAWTSCAAASMLRLKSNCSAMLVFPSELFELIAVNPAMVENCFSSGSATDAAIVSGLAPGNPADT